MKLNLERFQCGATCTIGKLFVAGVFPGLLTTLGYLITISLVLRLKPELGPDPVKEAQFAAES